VQAGEVAPKTGAAAALGRRIDVAVKRAADLKQREAPGKK